jgi:hypothetical protein
MSFAASIKILQCAERDGRLRGPASPRSFIPLRRRARALRVWPAVRFCKDCPNVCVPQQDPPRFGCREHLSHFGRDRKSLSKCGRRVGGGTVPADLTRTSWLLLRLCH